MRDVFTVKQFLAACAMFLALGASFVMQPDKAKAGAQNIGLAKMVPDQFGPWRIDPQSTVAVASPDITKKLSEVYAETLSRTYINERGQRVMLSMAYAGDIVRQMDVHRPEVCYPAQGFLVVQEPNKTRLESIAGGLGVTRLVAKQGARVEPITYWITAGDNAGVSTWERKWVRLRYGLTGQLPDGMLVRVSTIGSDTQDGFRVQEEFVQTMVSALGEHDRRRLLGGAL